MILKSRVRIQLPLALQKDTKRSEQMIRSELPLIKILKREDRIRLRYSDLEFILSPVLLLFSLQTDVAIYVAEMV